MDHSEDEQVAEGLSVASHPGESSFSNTLCGTVDYQLCSMRYSNTGAEVISKLDPPSCSEVIVMLCLVRRIQWPQPCSFLFHVRQYGKFSEALQSNLRLLSVSAFLCAATVQR